MDAYTWCRSNLPNILGEENIDLDAFLTAGDSAGGTMSTLLPHYMNPRPRVVIDVFGVVDPTWDKFLTPSSHHEPYLRDRDEGKMEKMVNDKDKGNAEFICPWDWELEPNMSEDDLRLFWGMPDFKVKEKHYERMDLNKYLAKKGIRFTLLHERDKFEKGEEGEKEFLKHLKSQSSYWLLMDNKGKGYPPTFFLHGTGDNAVPVEQSYQMAKALKELGVDIGEKYCPGGEHCFENKIEVSRLTCAYLNPVKLSADEVRVRMIQIGISILNQQWNLSRSILTANSLQHISINKRYAKLTIVLPTICIISSSVKIYKVDII